MPPTAKNTVSAPVVDPARVTVNALPAAAIVTLGMLSAIRTVASPCPRMLYSGESEIVSTTSFAPGELGVAVGITVTSTEDWSAGRTAEPESGWKSTPETAEPVTR